MLRKIFAIAFIICLAFTLVGYHLLFHFQQESVKAEMRLFLKDQYTHIDVLQLLLKKGQLQQLNWKDEFEFSFNGNLYDVIEIKMEGELVKIRFIADKKETALLSEYQKNHKQHSSNSIISHLITLQFVLPSEILLIRDDKIIKEKYIYHSVPLHKLPSSISTPPPEVCWSL